MKKKPVTFKELLPGVIFSILFFGALAVMYILQNAGVMP